MIDGTTLLRAALALAAVLALAWLATRAARSRLPVAGKRLAVAEVLALDARRRLVLVRCDDRCALLLTGGSDDRLLGWLPPGEPEP